MQGMFNEANEFVQHLIKCAVASAAGRSAHTWETCLTAASISPFPPPPIPQKLEANSQSKLKQTGKAEVQPLLEIVSSLINSYKISFIKPVTRL